MQSACPFRANNGHVTTASTGPKCRRPHVLAAPTTKGMAAIGSTMPAAPAVPPAPAAVPSHLDQLTLLRHRLGSCGQRSDRGSDSRYAEQHRTNHKKRCRNFELRHDIPPIRNFRPQSTWLTAVRCIHGCPLWRWEYSSGKPLFYAPTPKFSRHECGRPSNGVTSDMGPTRKSWQNTTQLTMLLPVYEIQDAEFARRPAKSVPSLAE